MTEDSRREREHREDHLYGVFDRDYHFGPRRDDPEQAFYRFSDGRRQVRSADFTGYGPRNYRRSDERINDEICENLSRCGEIDARDIAVEVRAGEVTLSGLVSDRWSKRHAEAEAEVWGVRDIHNQLQVRARQQRGMPVQGSKSRH